LLTAALLLAVVSGTSARLEAEPVAAKAKSKAAPPTPAQASACDQLDQCEIYWKRCCGPCGDDATQARVGDVVAYNGEYVSEHGRPACTGGVSCPACVEFRPSGVLATCERSRCVVKSLDSLGATRCSRDDECVPHTLACCACSWDGAVAVRKDAIPRLYALSCEPGTGCGRCARPSKGPATLCRKGRCALAEPARD